MSRCMQAGSPPVKDIGESTDEEIEEDDRFWYRNCSCGVLAYECDEGPSCWSVLCDRCGRDVPTDISIAVLTGFAYQPNSSQPELTKEVHLCSCCLALYARRCPVDIGFWHYKES